MGEFWVKIKINLTRKLTYRIGSLKNTRAARECQQGLQLLDGSGSGQPVERALFFLRVRNASSAIPFPNPGSLSYKENLVLLV